MNRPLLSAFLGLLLLLAGQAGAFESKQISIQAEGSGPDVILIHGFGCPPDIWAGVVKKFSPQFKLHLVRMLGFAGSPAPEKLPEHCLLSLRDEIVRYISEEKLKDPMLVGHSMGGLTSLLVGAVPEAGISSAVIIDAVPFLGLVANPGATVEQVRPMAKLVSGYLAGLGDEAFSIHTEGTISMLTKSQEHKDLLLKWCVTSDRKLFAHYLRELMTCDARPDLEKITCPVVVLYAYDKSMPQTEAHMQELYTTAYAGLKAGTIRQIPDSMHCIMWDQPESLDKALEEILSRQSNKQ